MIHCKACNDEMQLQLMTEATTDDPAGLNHYEILCDRCRSKMEQALASFEWDEILEGTYIAKHCVGGPIAAFWPWEFQYV